ncbi:hypothetical protein AN1V17_39540 [Vallitalea sediminicola]
MEDDIIIVKKECLEVKHKCEHHLFEYFKYEVNKTFDSSKFKIAIYEIPPKKISYPYHYHLKNEEAFYIISGKGLLKTHDSERVVTKGDIIVCPPSEKGAHLLQNTSDTELLTYIEFDICYYPEVIVYPNTNKIGVFEDKDKKLIFDKSSSIGYYDKE